MIVKPLHTKVEKTIQTMAGEVVLEHHAGFPSQESNLYLLDANGDVIWKAEKPDPRTLFSRVKLNDDYTLSTYTINGHACDLDLENGKIVGEVTTL
ncbi:MAG: hypothetical protein FJZ87_15685 [Chloroflexi bacterium]|nr:hypothetical protein [Chloroflexota bacterium]